jgi:hypothetical protein
MNEKLQKVTLLVTLLEKKNVKAARLKMFESIDKSLSKLLKKTANQNKGLVLE